VQTGTNSGEEIIVSETSNRDLCCPSTGHIMELYNEMHFIIILKMFLLTHESYLVRWLQKDEIKP
jgi:hypothetical protein